LNEEEVARLAVEFYKLIPKSKKEDYNIDELISNPRKSKARSKKIDDVRLTDMQIEIKDFIEHARDMCYIRPNRIVTKKERAGWRFKVKRWHKELMKRDRADGDLKLQAKILRELYELLCESCYYRYFTAYDTFKSVGVDQVEFFADIIDLYHEATGKLNTIEIGIHLMADNTLNRYTLDSDLMEILITKHDLPDLKYKGIEYTKKLIKEKGYRPKPQTQRSYGADFLVEPVGTTTRVAPTISKMAWKWLGITTKSCNLMLLKRRGNFNHSVSTIFPASFNTMPSFETCPNKHDLSLQHIVIKYNPARL